MINFKSARKQSAQVGRRGENAACKFLESRGMTILARNWKCRAGELDIVALDENELVFAEVKTRSKLDNYLPGANLSDTQKKRIRRGARVYMRKHHIPENIAVRFDLVEVIHDERKVTDIALHEKYMTFSGPMRLKTAVNGDILSKVY